MEPNKSACDDILCHGSTRTNRLFYICRRYSVAAPGRSAGSGVCTTKRITLDYIEVHSKEKMTVVSQSGIRISAK